MTTAKRIGRPPRTDATIRSQQIGVSLTKVEAAAIQRLAVQRAVRPAVLIRVPTTFVQKYTARAQLKPSGASRAGLRARETGGDGRPARFCQEQTLVLAEQFGSMEHDGFRVPYLSANTRKPHSIDRAVDRAAGTCGARP